VRRRPVLLAQPSPLITMSFDEAMARLLPRRVFIGVSGTDMRTTPFSTIDFETNSCLKVK
jgi:hypothetical protein